MRFDVLTIFPSFFEENPYFKYSILGEATKKGQIEVHTHDIREYSEDKHKKVDDTPYGGGAGMVMTCQPLFAAIKSVKKENPKAPVVFLTPQGETWTQPHAEEFATKHEQTGLILLCGRYEGIDQRVRDALVDIEISIGDYVLTGGELAVMTLIDSITRLIPGVLGNENSPEEDSFCVKFDRKKEYPHYTKPEEFQGIKVPDVLLSGHHANIEAWRHDNLK
ncbi:tRNA (guanosine(37)-N1)-methyltransferase TrmD [Candidatus Peregrinibacteria bacterium]|jgi:tRNA (guanine37-N1)-methyltransferase|nr:tRNA (guanosine(37)-N1)-methyltransferase TrmD [Candidatus Peregrinibacteria bacterium]MBT7483608.1 tRNA (guanosine(37)-N1)-methyltransferase TrmD [Candidatus Peregrinibacteria bacterium]MBT7702899.1 tRNA (guanosine(37)-N1)-methyltransferase TrmD [Candidatus Peregrinibacteria bacterium]